MKGNSQLLVRLRSAVLLSAVLAACGCRSYHIEITVENRTGSNIQLLEVDYPSASFGSDSVATDADFHYRIQVQGNGPLKVQYSAPGGLKFQMNGPNISERQQGRIEIVLLPGGKAEFHPELTPDS